MRISTEILVSAYGLFRAQLTQLAPASLAAGARGWKTRAAAETTLNRSGGRVFVEERVQTRDIRV